MQLRTRNDFSRKERQLKCSTGTKIPSTAIHRLAASQTQFSTKNRSEKLASFFYRTGISFRLADSESFRASVSQISPSYAKDMPSSQMLSGNLLDKSHKTEAEKLNILLGSSSNLTLISDGWTNVLIFNKVQGQSIHFSLMEKGTNDMGTLNDVLMRGWGMLGWCGKIVKGGRERLLRDDTSARLLGVYWL